MDVSRSAISFQILDIVTPYGLLRDSIPIPGDVIQEMSASIDQLIQNFPPRILIGPPTSLTFSVDEGRGFSNPQSVVLTNNGVFGSLLTAALTTSAAYVGVSPASLGNLAANESGSFAVTVDSTDLLATSSPYSETVSVQDPNASNTPQVLSVTINVRPKSTISAAPLTLTFNVVKPLTGPFPSIPSQLFTIENIGPAGSVLEFQVQALTGLAGDWLSDFTPVQGSLVSSSTQDITVSVAPIEAMMAGTYEETLRISGYSTNSYVDVLVRLVIT